MRLTLVPDGNQTYDIKRIGVRVSLGRKQGCDILLSDVVVSGIHCYITMNSMSAATVEDMSTNGTYINGVKIGKGLKLDVKEGDMLTLGKPSAVGDGQAGCVNFELSFDGERTETPKGGDSVMWRQEIEDLKVLVSQAQHRNDMSERKLQEVSFKFNASESELKRTKEDNVELSVRNDSMRSEIEQLRYRLQSAERTSFEADKRAETLQAKIDYMDKEFSEIAALKGALNLKHTTLSEEIERLRKENYELSNRVFVSGDVKKRLMNNLMTIQQVLGSTMGICEDMSGAPSGMSPPVVQTKRSRDTPARGYPVMEQSVETGKRDNNFFIGSGMTIMADDGIQIDSLAPSRKNTEGDMHKLESLGEETY